MQVGQHELKKFLHYKGNNQQSEKAASEWDKIFANHVPVKRLISKL